MNDTTPRYRRLEGLPLSWQQLTDKQRAAVKVAAELLLDALRSLERRNSKQSEPLDRDRRSQMAFIDGNRGMGKSSVLLSIQALLQEDKLDDTEDDPVDPVVRLLHDGKERFVWLETLDMEPLPRHANILAAILARIDAKAELAGRIDKSPRMAAAFDDLDHFEKTIMNLRNLQSTAVQAWAGTDPRRAEHINPVAYADEVLACEKAGLELHGRLTQLLEELSKLQPVKGRWRDPIFIVPVDDFDLAPTRCLELLRIVRMISTPRLFFLVAGNTRMAEDALRLQCEGELAALAGEQMAGIETSVIRERSIVIAANNLRKLVPPEQRARLESVGIEEAMELSVSGAGGKTLDEVLTGIHFHRNIEPVGAKPTSLNEFLLLNNPDEFLNYSGAVWLGGTPRQVLDRTAAFSRHHGSQSGSKNRWGESLLRTLSAELYREIHEDTQLVYDQRELLSNVVNIADYVRFDFTKALRLEVWQEGEDEVPIADGILHIRYPEKACWLFRSPAGQKTVTEWPVPRRIAAGLTFLHDLAISLWGGYVPPPGIYYDIRPVFPLVEVLWGSAVTPEAIRWHIPGWWTIREYERFFSYWKARAASCSKEEEYATAWLASQFEVLRDEPFDGTRKGVKIDRLGRMLEQLTTEEPTRDARKNLRKSALVTTTLFLAPESGISAEFTASLLTKAGKTFPTLDEEVIERVRTWRATTFVRVKNARLQSTRPLTPSAIKLLSSICAEAAIEMAWGNLQEANIPPKPEPLPTHRRLNIDNVQRFKQDNLQETIDQGYRRPSIFEKLLHHREILSLSREDTQDLCQALDIAIAALQRPYSAHPINQWHGGKLVPSAQEIAEIEHQDLRQRTNP